MSAPIRCHPDVSGDELCMALECEIRRAREVENWPHARLLEDIEVEPREVHDPQVYAALVRFGGSDHARGVFALADATLRTCGDGVYVHLWRPGGDDCDDCGGTGRVWRMRPDLDGPCGNCKDGRLDTWRCVECGREDTDIEDAGGYHLYRHAVGHAPMSRGPVCIDCVAREMEGKR